MASQSLLKRIGVVWLMILCTYIGYITQPYGGTCDEHAERSFSTEKPTYPAQIADVKFYSCPSNGSMGNPFCLNYGFKQLLSPSLKCGVNISLLIMVTSIANHTEHRKILRKTWCKDADLKGGSVRHIFLFGRTSTSQEQDILAQEAKAHGDILQDDFIENFRNLTLKTIMAFRWFAENCKQAKYIMKTDDDMFVNTISILRIFSHTVIRNAIFGQCYEFGTVVRNRGDKLYVPFHQYPGHWYPRYCSGTGYVLSSDLALKVHEVIPKVPVIPVDDAFIGECVERVRGHFIKESGFGVQGLRFPHEKLAQGVISGKIRTIHRLNLTSMGVLWNSITKNLTIKQ